MQARLTATVYGEVVGVMFRDYVARNARALSLTGFVRNTADRTVLVVAEGERANLDKLLEKLHTCPLQTVIFCRVDRVQSDLGDTKGEFQNFVIKYD